MSKTKEKKKNSELEEVRSRLAKSGEQIEALESEVSDLKEELKACDQGVKILQGALDFLGENNCRVCWSVARDGQAVVDVKSEDLRVIVDVTDPIDGLLEAIDKLKARMMRRKINRSR